MNYIPVFCVLGLLFLYAVIYGYTEEMEPRLQNICKLWLRFCEIFHEETSIWLLLNASKFRKDWYKCMKCTTVKPHLRPPLEIRPPQN